MKPFLNFIQFGLLLVLANQVLQSKSVDLTIEEEAVGEDVVDAVVRKISRSTVFKGDSNFLRRLAYVESEFGEADYTFKPDNYTGGIWQLDESKYNQTKEATLALYHWAIHQYIDPSISWMDTTWADLLKPLHSGIATRLFLAKNMPGDKIPGTVQQQAEYWAQNYNGNPNWNAQYFIQQVAKLESNPECQGVLDLCIVLDGSGSIGPADFSKAKQFVSNLVGTFSLNTTRIALIVYSDKSIVEFSLDNGFNVTQMQSKILNVGYPLGGTHTGTAMLEAIKQLQSTASPRPGVPHVMAVFTDGNSNGGTSVSAAAEKVAQAEILSFAIGIGQTILELELEIIALNDTTRVFLQASYDELSEFFHQLNSEACTIPQRPGLNQTIEDELRQNERRYYSFEIVSEEGLTIKHTNDFGETQGFYSYTEQNPSSAMHDGEINGFTFVPNPAEGAGSNSRKSGLFVAVKGLRESNKYSIAAVDGNQTNGSTLSVSFSLNLAFALVVICSFM